jgi:PAS domain S-box-containing protein
VETELKLRLESLVKNEARYRNIFDHADDIILTHDSEGNITSVNETTKSITGYLLEELLCMKTKQLIAPEHLGLAIEMYKRKVKDIAYKTTFECDLITKDGRRVPVEWCSTMVKENGKPVEVHAIIRDITDRKKAEQTLSESAMKYQSLINNASDAILLLTTGGKIIEANKKAESLLGYTREELFELRFKDLHPREEAYKYAAIFQEIIEKGSTFLSDGIYITKLGKAVPVDISANVFEYADKKLIQAFIRDISERKIAENLITRQAQEIMEISIPVMQIWEGVVVAPLIGTLDSLRAEQFTERLLEKIVELNSPVALVDITGVPSIDTRTAQHLIDTISAVRLLGGKAILTGVRPAIAQTLVHLGINLADVITRSSLAAGLRVALQILDLQVVNIRER